MANVLIRVGSAGDLAALAGLNGEVQALHFASRPDQFKPVDLDHIERWIADLLGTPSATVWVAELDGVLVGYAMVQRRERAETPFCPARRWWDLDAIGVRAQYRRTGVGRALMQKIVSEATAQGVAEIELTSWAFNESAQAAFRSLGFVRKVIRFERRLSGPLP